jgi:hypothetical protein
MTSRDDGAIWERGWDGHEISQRERLSRFPLSETLRWLEEAHRLVLHLSGIVTPPARCAGDREDVTRPSP